MSETFRLLEHTQGGAPERVDRAACVIHGVKVLGEQSKNPPPNDNEYPPETRQAALPLIEGIQVGVNHLPPNQATQARPYEATNGFLRGARAAADSVLADWWLNPKHALTEQILWDAENNVRNLGFSINGDGRRRHENGRHLVEAITRLDSVDLVSRPATTNGLFEAQRPPMRKKVRELIESLKAARPGYARGLREAAEAGLMSQDAEMEEPAPMGLACAKGPPDESAAVDHGAAILQAAMACLQDDALDTPTKISKIKKLLGIKDESGAAKGGKGATEDETDPDDPGAMGSAALRGKNQAGQIKAIWHNDPHGDYHPSAEGRKSKPGNLQERLKLQIAVRDLCADEDVRPGHVLRKALDACATLQEARELLQEHKKGQSTGVQPQPLLAGARSSAPTRETFGLQEAAKPVQPANGTGWTFQGADAAEQRLAKLRNTR